MASQDLCDRDHISVPARALWTGAICWFAFAVFATALRGVRWEECYHRALIVSGSIVYPPGHPVPAFIWAVLQPAYLLSAGLIKLNLGPALICGLWNAVFLAAGIVPLFLLTSLSAGRVIYGHAAVAVLLSGAVVPFAPYYPIGIWPSWFTSGQIGLGLALLIPFFVLNGHAATAGFFLGLMLVLHPGHLPAPLLLAVALGGWGIIRRHGDFACRRLGAGLLAGGGISIAFIVFRALLPGAPDAVDGAYCTAGADWLDAWRRYTFHNDVHRAYPRFAPVSHAIIALAACGWLGISATRRWGRPFAVLTGLAAIAAALAGVCGGIQAVMGESTPFAVLGWMPYRMLNYGVLLLIPIALGIIGRSSSATPNRTPAITWGLAALLLYVAARPLMHFVIPGEWYARYAAAPEMVIFAVIGLGAAGNVTGRYCSGKRSRFACAIISVGGLMSIGYWHQFGAACALAMFAGALIMPGLPRMPWLSIACAAAVVSATAVEWSARAPLHREAFDAEVKAYLSSRGEDQVMVLGPLAQNDLMERLGHPIVLTYDTQHLITYVPRLGPVIERMHADLYGLRFGEPWHYDLAIWRDRPQAQWQELARAYGFRYVLAPDAYALDLPLALKGTSSALYAIP